MENKKKEYLGIVIITLLHGLYTYCELGRMPHISFGILDSISMGAFFLWLIYGMCLYLIVQGWVIQADNMKRHCILSLGFGIISALVKGSIDFGITKLSDYLKSVIKLAYMDEITTVVFYILLTCILIIFIAKRKIHFDIRRVKVPLTILLGIVLSYVGFVIRYVHQNQTAIIAYDATEKQIFNLDYHFGMKILDGNVWFYVIFYITFWWFMRRLTEKTEEKQGDSL